MTVPKQELTSLNIADAQIQKLKSLFPEVFTEGAKIDFEKLKRTLGENVDTGKERYGMNWPGKADCFKTIQQPSVATLVPDRDESVDFDNTQNLFIEGDNLEVLKLLQKSYLGKVKMIYIDPPYNTGNDFIYPDNFSENLQTYLEYTGQIDSEGRKFGTNPDTDGRFHSKWLNMMYPRLFLAKNLLREDGVIFISIDDNEVHNLRALCNEIFGEENFVANICHKSRASVSNDKIISSNHNHILLFAKDEIKIFENRKKFGVQPILEGFDKEDEKGKYKLVPVDGPGGAKKGNPHYEFMGITGYWRFSKERMQKMYDEGLVVITKNNLQQKYYFHDAENSRRTVTTWWDENLYTSTATARLSTFLGGNIFDTPKPIELIQKMLELSTDDSDIILDFFAGSATTAHAVMELNKEDGGNRKYICVQLPEPTDENSEAFKANYRTIAEISKERIRRVIKKIKAEQAAEAAKAKGELFEGKDTPALDLGFKVYKLQKSHFKIWDSSLERDPSVIQGKLFDHIAHISPEAEQEGILYELLLKSGFELTTEIKRLTLADKTVFSILENTMLICLEKNLTHECLKAMAEMQPSRVICLDEAFTGANADALKTNAVQIMRSKGVDNFRTV